MVEIHLAMGGGGVGVVGEGGCGETLWNRDHGIGNVALDSRILPLSKMCSIIYVMQALCWIERKSQKLYKKVERFNLIQS